MDEGVVYWYLNYHSFNGWLLESIQEPNSRYRWSVLVQTIEMSRHMLLTLVWPCSVILAFTRFNEFLYCYICYKIYWYKYCYSILSPSRLLCYSISLQNTKETDGLHMPQLCVLGLKQQFVNAHSLRWLPKRFNILKSTVVNVLDNLIKLKD